MKSTLAVISAFCFTTFLSTSALAADSKSEALTECKQHVSGLYEDGLRTKVKRIKKRGGDFEVKLRVSAEGERFNAVCAFADGSMTYTTDRASSTAD
jgi:hypothetical protein